MTERETGRDKERDREGELDHVIFKQKCYSFWFFDSYIEMQVFGKSILILFLVYIYIYIRKRPNQEFFAEPEPNRTSDYFLPNRTFVHMIYARTNSS